MNSQITGHVLSEAINYLAVNIYKELSKESGNVFFSPFSISSAFAMAFIGSSHETAKEMASVLGYERANIKRENIKINFQHLFSEMTATPQMYTLDIANVLFRDCELFVREDFKSMLVDFFNALIVDIDSVSDSVTALKKGNDWVKTKTNGNITDLLDSWDCDSKLVILNAVYFKGVWLQAFKEKSTFLQYFYNNGAEEEAKLVEMMHLKDKFSYAEDVSCKALKLPYKGENMSMFLFLPNMQNGVDELEKQISVEFLKNIKELMHQTEIEVAMPKLHLEYSKSLKRFFQNLGMTKAFNTGAHFDKISTSKDFLISEIVHKTVLEVNEEGTEASTATAIALNRCCLTNCPEFVVDHPFLFFIYDCRNDLILFIGKVLEL